MEASECTPPTEAELAKFRKWQAFGLQLSPIDILRILTEITRLKDLLESAKEKP